MTANATLTGSIQRSKKWLALPVGCVVLSLGLLTGGVPAAHAEGDTGESLSTATSETAELPGDLVVDGHVTTEVDADVDADVLPEASLDEQPAATPGELPVTDGDVDAANSIAEQQAGLGAKAAPVAEAPASSNAVAAAGDAPYTKVNDSWWDFPEPILSGRPQVGKKLTATHVPAPAGSASVSYQWYRTDVGANGDMVKINGATGRSYTPTAADTNDWLTFQIRIVRNSTLWTKFGLSVGPIRTDAAFVAPAKSPFIDVAKATQFYTPISWMKKADLSTGTKSGAYLPKDGVSREAMAAFMFRYQGSTLYTGPATSPFADVRPGDKFYNEIAWMYETGLSTGVKQKSGKPKYSPKSKVSREAMAAFIYRLEASKASTPSTTPFKDVKPGAKFYKEIAWMSTSGLSTGIKQQSGKPKYAPKSTVSREAMAAFLYRLEGK